MKDSKADGPAIGWRNLLAIGFNLMYGPLITHAEACAPQAPGDYFTLALVHIIGDAGMRLAFIFRGGITD